MFYSSNIFLHFHCHFKLRGSSWNRTLCLYSKDGGAMYRLRHFFKFFTVSLFLLLIFPGWVGAHNDRLVDFKLRFEFIRNETGQLIEIRDRSITKDISPQAFVRGLRESLWEIHTFLSDQDVDANVDMIMEEILHNSSPSALKDHSQGASILNLLRPHLRSSLTATAEGDVDVLFDRSQFKEFLRRFERDILDNLRFLGLNVVARPQDSKFFFKRAVSYQIVHNGLTLAKRFFSDVPLLNLATFIVSHYESLVRTRRSYHQNMLLHYLENFSSEDLGLSQQEVAQTLSSVYESRISWLGFNESKRAKAEWESYGQQQFYNGWRQNYRRLLRHSSFYVPLGERLNFAFQEGEFEDQKVILNLQDKVHMFSDRPAIAYYYDAPKRVGRRRALYLAAQVGLILAPIPGFVRQGIDGFLDSLYEQHSLTEGALAAYFVSQGEEEIKEYLFNQSLNPFLTW